MSATPPPNGSIPTADLKKARESFSQFAARVLDQLSISAWLPAGVLVFGVLLIGELRLTRDLSGAVDRIAEMSWGAIVLSLGAVVLTTIATQAFGFGAIRLLEGYWGSSWLALVFADASCWRQIRRRDRYIKAAHRTEEKAADKVLVLLMKTELPSDVAKAVVATPLNLKVQLSDEEEQIAAKHSWQQYADPRHLRRLDAFEKRAREYPEQDDRVLPTRLGNLIRSAEQTAKRGPSKRLENWIVKHFSSLPTSLQVHHDEHRTRLDLYATMIFVTGLLGVVAFVALYRPGDAGLAVWASMISTVGIWLSCRALMASARAYASALVAIGEWLQEHQAGVTATDQDQERPASRPS